MEILTILDRARETGLTVQADGNELVIRGPKRAEAMVWVLAKHKAEVLAVLASVEHVAQRAPERAPQAGEISWGARYRRRVVDWMRGGRRKDEAERLAYGELLDEWRNSHGRRWPVWQCAGCDEPIGGLSVLLLADENRVHFDEERECLIRCGRRWRGEAVAELQALGFEPPAGFKVL
jgi:hypothetical protein